MKGPLRGKSIQANLLPQHLEDIWDKRVDKQVKCYSICSRTNTEKCVLLEDQQRSKLKMGEIKEIKVMI